MNHEIHEIHERWNNRTTNGHEWDTNSFFIGKKVVRGWRARASLPPRVPYMILSLPLTPRHLPCSKESHCKVSTHSPLPSSPSSPLLKPTAKCPRTTFSPLLPPPYERRYSWSIRVHSWFSNGRVALLPRGRAQARQPHVISQRRGRGHSLPEDYSRIQDPFRNIYLAVMRCLR